MLVIVMVIYSGNYYCERTKDAWGVEGTWKKRRCHMSNALASLSREQLGQLSPSYPKLSSKKHYSINWPYIYKYIYHWHMTFSHTMYHVSLHPFLNIKKIIIGFRSQEKIKYYIWNYMVRKRKRDSKAS